MPIINDLEAPVQEPRPRGRSRIVMDLEPTTPLPPFKKESRIVLDLPEPAAFSPANEAVAASLAKLGEDTSLLPLAARVAGPLGGLAIAGPFGAAVGGALGEGGAQLIEKRLLGTREEISVPAVAAASFVAGIPAGRTASLLGTVGREALTGMGAASIPAIDEGRLPKLKELAIGAGLGALGGGLIRRGNIRREARARLAREAEEAARPPERIIEEALDEVQPTRPPQLEEGVGEVERAGAQEGARLGPLKEVVVEPQVMKATTEGVQKDPRQLAELAARRSISELADPQKRLFTDLFDMLQDGSLDLDEGLTRAIKAEGYDVFAFLEEARHSASTAGRLLNPLSRLQRSLNQLVKRETDRMLRDLERIHGIEGRKAAAAREALQEKVARLKSLTKDPGPPNWWEFFMEGGSWDRWMPGLSKILPDVPGYRKFDTTRRRALVGQFATFARNFMGQLARISTEVLDLALQNMIGRPLGREPTREAAELLHGLVTAFGIRGFKARRAFFQEIDELLQAMPIARERLLSRKLGEISEGIGLLEKLNRPNTWQEEFYRKIRFHAALKSGLQRRGISLADAIENPRVIPKEVLEEGIESSLEATFAATPRKGFSNAMVRMYKDMPLLTTINPFPRFLSNSWKFLTDYNPVFTPFRLMRQVNQEGLRAYQDPKVATKVLAQAAIGTTFLAGALALRSSKYAGGRWYELKLDDGRTFDARPFAPFSTYLFMAEVFLSSVRAISEARIASLQRGQTFSVNELLDAWEHQNLSMYDFMQGILSINRIAGTGLVGVELLKEGFTERGAQIFADAIGQYIGGFTVPARILKDAVAGFAQIVMGQDVPEEAIFRETRSRDVGEAALASTVQNFPFATRLLPKAAVGTRAGPAAASRPFLRQATGLIVKERNPVEEEIARLGVDRANYVISRGDDEFDRAASRRMGELTEAVLVPFVRSAPYQQTSDRDKKLVLSLMLRQVRQQAQKEVIERPEMQGVRAKFQLQRLSVPLKERVGSRSLERRLDELFKRR
jgi:hypothetical protein